MTLFWAKVPVVAAITLIRNHGFAVIDFYLISSLLG